MDTCGGQEVVAYHFEGGFAAAEQSREEGLDFAVDGVESFFETRFGFVVDLGDGFFQKRDGGLHVFALAAVVAVAFARFFEFLQGGEVDGVGASICRVRLPMLLFNTFADSFANASSASRSAARSVRF